ncbi:hypothetical protein F0562_019978 [Nyssa sinensis]|uniref:Uncharacterized protein n=1 Tax=Nyssa sinensis TaxID=561372 RepID=A0A5J5BPQ7_9ASTE|nr:hypothetical protein F0562_019978 [Nyssa sinensis]
MLGSQWSKDELQRFYEAYRNYGKDWKKVAGVVRNRSVEMVEALYNMNRAYLSLPEGTASVAGLIAMMTDHYNVLEGSDSDREGNYASRLPQNPHKRGRGKVQLSASKEDRLQSLSVVPNDGCLSLLKRRRSDGCAVGKRTPRFPVSYSFRKDDGENYVSPNKRVRKSEVSHSPYKTERMKSSPLHTRERKCSQSERSRAKLPGIAMDEDCLEGSLSSRGAENGDYARDTSALMDIEGAGMAEVYQKGRKFNRKKEKVEDIKINQFDDGREACSGTEEDLDIEITNAKIERSSSQDESFALDALQTLADLSLMMPASTIESESSVQLNEEKPILDLADRSSVVEAISISHRGDKRRISGVRERILHASSEVEPSKSGKCKLERDSAINVNSLSEGQQQRQSSNKVWKRKRKSSSLKAFAEVEEKPINKGKRTGQLFASPKQWKSIRPAECSSSNSDQKRAGTDSAASTAHFSTTSQVNLPTKQRSRRKMDPKRMLIQKEMKSPETISKDQPNYYSTSPQDRDMLSSCLSSHMVRKWCTCEWFYSAIDYPWFAKREFVEYLNHVGLGHIPRLTRVEWGVIRSSLGKPRRFSEHFLLEEKEKLKQYRESVRKHYAELRAGIREGLPTDLARPLSVGQRVIALHPKSREVHDGNVLTIDHDKCRIQFDHPELGVEFVMDIDCMPLNPLENMPEALRRQKIAVDKFSANSREHKAGQLNIDGSVIIASSEHLENVCSPLHTLITQAKDDTTCAISQTKAATSDIVNMQQAAHIHAREADMRALSDLTCALDKKEAILLELKHSNDDVFKNQKGGGNSLNDSELFKKQYATVLLQLKEASDQVSSALLNLRERNTYPGNSLSPLLKPPAISSGLSAPPSSVGCSAIDYQESGSNVVEIVRYSRSKAHVMVDAAIQAMWTKKEGEDAFVRIGEALDSLNKRKFSSNSGSSVMRSPEQVNGVVAYQHHLSPSMVELLQTGHVSGPNLHNDSERTEAEIPSELITSCVATLLMVQTCTERQYPPADVAQIMDSAVTSLHPCCFQNLPIYRQIQMCMGRIKTQILALVPT